MRAAKLCEPARIGSLFSPAKPVIVVASSQLHRASGHDLVTNCAPAPFSF
jgi:hypothetical protein